jgi:hypothetical protein
LLKNASFQDAKGKRPARTLGAFVLGYIAAKDEGILSRTLREVDFKTSAGGFCRLKADLVAAILASETGFEFAIVVLSMKMQQQAAS